MYAINSFNSHQDVILLSFIAIGLQHITVHDIQYYASLIFVTHRRMTAAPGVAGPGAATLLAAAIC